MALAVIGRLVSSTLLSLILVPVVYELISDLETWLTPKLGRLASSKLPSDDAPIVPEDETLVTKFA